MYLSHVSIAIPRGSERIAREFYVGVLGLREITSCEAREAQGEMWLDAGAIELRLLAQQDRVAPDNQPRLALGCGDLQGLRERLIAAGAIIGEAFAAQRLLAIDPFGNRLEIHVPGNRPLLRGPA